LSATMNTYMAVQENPVCASLFQHLNGRKKLSLNISYSTTRLATIHENNFNYFWIKGK
jgi:hypothetical protein